MLIKNLDQAGGLVNGSKGCVIDFRKVEDEDGSTEYPVVKFANGSERVITEEEWSVEMPKDGKVTKVARRSQVPLKLGWAITIHKSQGMGMIDRGHADGRRAGVRVWPCEHQRDAYISSGQRFLICTWLCSTDRHGAGLGAGVAVSGIRGRPVLRR